MTSAKTRKQPTRSRQSWSRKGCRYLRADHRCDLIFEAPGLAHDDAGKPVPAGLLLKIHLKEGRPATSPEAGAKAVRKTVRRGMPELQIGPNILIPLTWAQYVRRGYAP